MDGRVDVHPQNSGISPYVSQLFSESGTYERCSTVIFLSREVLTLGISPRVLTALHIPDIPGLFRDYLLSDSSERFISHPRGFNGVLSNNLTVSHRYSCSFSLLSVPNPRYSPIKPHLSLRTVRNGGFSSFTPFCTFRLFLTNPRAIQGERASSRQLFTVILMERRPDLGKKGTHLSTL